jgi:acetyl-CoA C-acetyltransferase
MAEAYIIDAVRTPRGVGKPGKGALSHLHPQQLAATVLKAIKERNNLDTATVDDVIWSTSTQKGKQGGDLGRMSALAAGYDVKASGMTLDRFCGGGITSVNLATAAIMSGMEDCVIAGGTEMMSYTQVVGAAEANAGMPARLMGSRQSGARRTSSAVAPGRLRRCDRTMRRHQPRGAAMRSLWSASSAPRVRSAKAASTSR